MSMFKNCVIVLALTYLLGSPAYAQHQSNATGKTFDEEEKQLHIIDGLVLRDLGDYVRFNLKYSEINKIDTLTAKEAFSKYDTLGDNGVVVLYTRVPIILNGTLLIDQDEKVGALSRVQPSQIKKIEWMSKKQLKRIYGVKIESGGVIVITD